MRAAETKLFGHMMASAFVMLTSLIYATAGYAAPDQSTALDCKVIGSASAFRNNHSGYDGKLLAATSAGDWPLVRGLLLLGAKPPSSLTKSQMDHVQLERESAELIPASARGDRKMVLQLLKAGADANAVANGDNYASPLAWAAKCERPDIVKILITHGADVNERFGYSTGSGWIDGSTALIWAAESGADRSVAILLSNRANVDAKESWLSTPSAAPIIGRSAFDAAKTSQIKAMLLKVMRASTTATNDTAERR